MLPLSHISAFLAALKTFSPYEPMFLSVPGVWPLSLGFRIVFQSLSLSLYNTPSLLDVN